MPFPPLQAIPDGSVLSRSGSSGGDDEQEVRTAQAVQSELVNLIERGRVLEIVLNDVDVVGGGQKTGELGCFGVPQRGRNDACTSRSVSSRSAGVLLYLECPFPEDDSPAERFGGGHAILNENVQALLHGKSRIEDNQAKTEGKNVVASAYFEEVANGTLFDAALVKIWI